VLLKTKQLTSIKMKLPILKINHKTHKSICLQEVIMLRGEVNYSIMCLKNGDNIMIAHTLKYFEDMLHQYGFMRVHRAFLVNPQYILNYDKVGHKMEMGSNLFAQVSRRKAKDLNMNWNGKRGIF
jgi:DNA-binding LytR/AlgR family response regulator